MPHITQFSQDRTHCVTKVYGECTFAEHLEIWAEMDQNLNQDNTQMLYWIIDLTDMIMSYQDLVRVVENSCCQTAGTVSDSRIIPLGVATEPTTEFIQDTALNREGACYRNLEIPFFATLDEAFSFLKFVTQGF